MRSTWRRLRLQLCCMLLPDLAWIGKMDKSLTADPSWALKALEKPVLFNGDHIGALMFAKLAKWWNDPVNGSIRLRRQYTDLGLIPGNLEHNAHHDRLEEAYKELEVCYLWSIEREERVNRIIRKRTLLHTDDTGICMLEDADQLLPELLAEEHELRRLDSTYLGLLLDNRYFMSEYHRIYPNE